MATYQNSIANLGVRLVITHQSPDIANNRTTINYSAYVYKTNGNPFNLLSQTPMKLTINGQSLINISNGNYDLRNTSQQLIKSGSLTIPHNSDGTKSFSFSWNVNFTSTGYGYGNVTTSGTYTLPTIPRTSTFSVASTMNTGTSYTLTINRSSGGFTHDVTYTVGGSETTIATSTTATSVTVNIPHTLFNRYPSNSTVTGTINVKTKNGSSVIGVRSQTVNINLPTNFKPSVSGLSVSNTRHAPMTSSNQLIRGVSRLTLTASGAQGAYSSTINGYEFRYKRANGNYEGIVSSSTNSFQYGVFQFPNSGSEVLTVEVRVRDSRGRYSDWKSLPPAVRVHFYQPPSIGNITVRRTGSTNTSLNVTRNYKVTPLYTGGGTTNNNTALLSFETRELGGKESTNTGANSSVLSLTNSTATLSGTFAANKSYEVRAVLKDSIQIVYSSWIRVSTESLPITIAPNGIGVGKAHSGSSYNLEVGSGGVNSDGAIKRNGFDISQNRHGNYKDFTVGGDANTYYPVLIRGQAKFGFHRYSITREYKWDAPTTWNNTTHKGGLTLDIEWSGDDNDRAVRVIEFDETYSTMVAGMALARGGNTGLIVWLRGGGALYRLYSEKGSMAIVNVHLGSFTDSAGRVFSTRTSPVDSEIYNRYPVRGNGELYSLGHKVLSENDVRTLLAGSPSNFDRNTFIQMVKTGVGHPVINFDANNFLHGIVWCYGSNTGTPPGDGLLFAYRINSNQATQVYFGRDNKLYQRQRDWQTGVWGAWSNGR